MTTPAQLSFTLDRTPLSPAEHRALADDVGRLGLDVGGLEFLDATLDVAAPHSTPLLLRARAGGALAGAAYVIECRRPMRSLFEGPVAHAGDRLGRPVVMWMRTGLAVDGLANPGFVASGLSRATFVAAARAHLARRYLAVLALEDGPAGTVPGALTTPFPDQGVLDLAGAGPDLLLARHRNLRRKLRRFAGHGGRVEVVRGPLEPALRDALLRCLASLKLRFVTPFQDLYGPLVAAAAARDDRRVLHLLAWLDGELAGYHSFLDCGSALHMLSGAFDRRRDTTWHAYENLVVASATLAADLGKASVEYGPVVNPTKAAMLTRFRASHLRVDARHAPVRLAFGAMLQRSRLAPARVAPYAGMQPRQLASA